MALSDWSFKKSKDYSDNWPLDENGEAKKPAFLTHVNGTADISLTKGLLEAFGIAVFCTFPNDGKFGELMIGTPGPGINIYVPEESLEDAKAILSGQGIEAEEE